MEVHILAVQARVLLWVGLAWLALGIWMGFDPATVAWRAALGALLAMWLSGKLLHLVAGVVNERMTTDLAERQAAAEAAEQAAAAAAQNPKAPSRPGAPRPGSPAPAPAPRPRPAEAKAR